MNFFDDKLLKTYIELRAIFGDEARDMLIKLYEESLDGKKL